MPAFSPGALGQDIKNFQMNDHETDRFGMTRDAAQGWELLSGRFPDFEELSTAVAAWDFDFVQLDAGDAPAVLTQVSGPGLLIQRFRFSRTYIQRGASPEGMRTFGLLESEGHDVQMFGDELKGSDLALFRANGEFDSVSRPGFGCLAISVDEGQVDEAFAAMDLPRGPGGEVTESGLLGVDPRALAQLRRRAATALDELEASPGGPSRTQLLEELSFELPMDLVSTIHSANGGTRQRASRIRDLALRRAVSIIEDRMHDPPTVRSLCQEVGVGWTVLVQAFREHFGVTPKTYVRAVRLNAVRGDLRVEPPEVAIADVANRWGFWHMGQFAADYRRLFGELPSETRGRVLRKGAGPIQSA
jgi:AraC-like DNA-binding protein